MNVVRVRPVTREERATIKQARDQAVRARLPKDTLGRTIIPQVGRHKELR